MYVTEKTCFLSAGGGHTFKAFSCLQLSASKEPSVKPWSGISSLITSLRHRLAHWLSRFAVARAPALRRIPVKVPLRVQAQYRDGWQPRSRYRR